MQNKTILVVAPHADDETLGCGGTILRLKEEGYEVHWLLVTGMTIENGFSNEQIDIRAKEIESVQARYQFNSVIQLFLPPAKLETLAKGEVIGPISKVVQQLKPSQVFTVYRNDAHSDHECVYDAVLASVKSFRAPFVKRVLAYETISETDFGYKPEDGGFKPNVYMNIEPYINTKLDIIQVFKSEIGAFPFPRSCEALDALAKLRGVQSGFRAAEAFMLIKEVL